MQFCIVSQCDMQATSLVCGTGECWLDAQHTTVHAHKKAGACACVFLHWINITSVRPTPNAGWKGSNQSFSLHFAEQAHRHNDMSKEPCSSGQLAQFLHASVGGLPSLSQVLTLHKTVKRAAGVTSNTNFYECLAALRQQAQVCNSSHGNRQTNSRRPHDEVIHGDS